MSWSPRSARTGVFWGFGPFPAHQLRAAHRPVPGRDAGTEPREELNLIIGEGVSAWLNWPPAVSAGLRVVEIGDDLGEYCGMVLAGLGAEVIKVEPPAGRRAGSSSPFAHDEPGPRARPCTSGRYNRGKRSIVLDLDTAADGRAARAAAAATSCSTPRRAATWPTSAWPSTSYGGHPRPDLRAGSARFGDDGPWAGLARIRPGSPRARRRRDELRLRPRPARPLRPSADRPASRHAYAIAGEQIAFIDRRRALRHRDGRAGQHLLCAIHEASRRTPRATSCRGFALRTPFLRQTCRHSAPSVSRHRLDRHDTKDGRWCLAVTRDSSPLAPFLD